MDTLQPLRKRRSGSDLPYLYPARKSQYFNTASLDRQNVSWIQTNIMRRECKRFVPARNGSMSSLCECGDSETEHEFLENTDVSSRDEWTIENDTRCLATNAFGVIEFAGPGSGFAQKPRKFARVDYKTDHQTLLELLCNEWNLETPKLLISITGGAKNFQLNWRLKEILRRGIMEAAVSTGAWIISGGTHSGVMKFVGEAVRDYQMSCRHEDVVAIGIATWGVLKQRRELIEEKGKYPARVITRKYNDNGGVSLDPNHTHFILVDDGTKGKFGAEISLRGGLEETISTKIKVGTGSSTHVPVVCVVIEGGPNTIRQAHAAIKNDTPLVVVSNSGRAADVMAVAFLQSHFVDDNGDKRKTMNKNLQDKVMKMLQVIEDGISEERRNLCLQHIEECLRKPHLLNVYEQSSRIDIDVVILTALMKGSNRKQQDLLRLAQVWDRIDIARSDRLAGSKDWEIKEGDAHVLLREALINNQTEFVKLYVENGVNLKAYLTHRELTHLYNQVQPGTVLYSHLAKTRSKSKDKNGDFTLMDVGRVIQSLTMETYKPPYMESRHDQKRFSDPIRELFLYAVLNKFEEMSRFFWEEGKETIAAALTASKIYRNMKGKLSTRGDAELKENLSNLSKQYGKLAISVLNECQKDDEQWASTLLLRELPNWGFATCVSLAGRNLYFIGHACVQDLITEIWHGHLSVENNTSLTMGICSLLPPLIPFLISYRRDDDTEFQLDANMASLSKYHTNQGFVENFEMQAQGKSSDDKPATSRPPPKTEIAEATGHVTQRTRLGLLRKIVYFYQSPRIIFRHNVAFYLLFLGLFSYIMLSNSFTTTKPSWYEYLLIVWVATLFTEEFRQIAQGDSKKWTLRIKQWISDYWNQVDLATLLLFATGTTFRFFPGALDAARVVLAFDLFIFYMRILNYFTIYRNIGPKLIMIGKMFLDLMFFFCILLVFLVGYGITLQVILYPSVTDVQSLVDGILYRPYFQIYGQLFLEEITGTEEDGVCTTNSTLIADGIPPCPQYSGVGVFLLAVYMIFSNVLLLNLLIAMFSYTFSTVQEKTDMYWKNQRFLLAKEYFNRPPLVPPLIIFSHIIFAIRFILQKCFCCRIWRKKTLTKKLNKNDVDRLVHWESVQAYKYISKIKFSKQLDVSGSGERLRPGSDGNESLLLSVNDLLDAQKGLPSRLTRLEDQMERCNKAIDQIASALKETKGTN